VTAEKKQQTNKQESETKYKYSQIKSFSSRLTKPETAPQIELRLSMNNVVNDMDIIEKEKLERPLRPLLLQTILRYMYMFNTS